MANIIMLTQLSWKMDESELLYPADCYFRFSTLQRVTGSYQRHPISAIFGLFAGGPIYKEGVARLGSKLI